MKKLHKFSISRLMNNNKFVLAISILSSIVIWVAVALNVSPDTERVVQDVKVSFESSGMSVPSQLGLTLFGEKDFYVDVTVVGKKYLVSSTALTADDIIVTAVTEYVSSAGKTTLELTAKPRSDSGEFEITALSKKNIEVYYDTEKSEEYTMVAEVTSSDDSIVAEGYIQGDPVLSVTTVTVTGPSTELAKIASVVARGNVSSALKSPTTLDAVAVLLDANGKEFAEYCSVTFSGTLTLTVPVYRLKTLPLAVNIKNAPAAYTEAPLKYSVNPESGSFKVSVDSYDTINQAIIGSVDFKELSPEKNVVTVPSSSLTSDIIWNDEKTDFTVTFDLSEYSSATFTVPTENITFINNANANEITIVNGLSSAVTVVGTEEVLAKLSNEDIFAEIDLSSVALEPGEGTYPARVYTSNDTCWAFGSYTCLIKY